MKRRLGIMFLFATALKLDAASFVLDSFTEGAHMLVQDGDTHDLILFNSRISERRTIQFLPRGIAPSTTVTSTLDTSNGGSLSLDIDGFTLAGSSITLTNRYSMGGPYSLLGSSAFEFDFSAVSGAGNIIVQIGPQAQAFFGPTVNRVAIKGPGTVSVPFSQLYFGTSGSIASFDSVNIGFESDTEQFSFVLDEIRVVPEPSCGLLFLGGGILVLLRRSRG